MSNGSLSFRTVAYTTQVSLVEWPRGIILNLGKVMTQNEPKKTKNESFLRPTRFVTEKYKSGDQHTIGWIESFIFPFSIFFLVFSYI